MHNRDSRRRRKRKGDWKYIWRNYGWKLSKSKGYWHQDTGSTEGPKQVEPKQAHTKTYYNKNGKKLKIKRRFQRQLEKSKALITREPK